MPDRTQARRDGCAHHDPFSQIKDMDAAWVRVQREISQVAGQTRRAVSALVPAGHHVQMLFRLRRSPGPLPPTPRRDPTWAASRS